MGMDIVGNNGNYFRSSARGWSTICQIMEMAGHEVPRSWIYNDGDGLPFTRKL